MTDPSNPAVRDRLDPALRDALDRADRLDEVAVLYDPVAALLEAYGLEERLAVVAVVSGGPSARIAALEAGALEALGPDLDPREAVLRLEMAIARFRSRLVLETAREHLGAQAQAVERDLRLAAQMQRSFLPQELPTDGVSVATAYLPREFTSGDTYDVRVLGDGRLALYTLDAVGHDVRAALLTVLLRSALRARGGDPSHEPHAMVQAANEALLAANLEESPTAAICYAILEPKTGALRYAAAGHPPPLVLRKGGGRERLTEGGLLLGIDEFPYASGDVTLAPGDAVFFFTDGVDPDNEAAQFCEQLAVHGDLSLEDQVAGALGATIELDAEGRPGDDVTVVALRLE